MEVFYLKDYKDIKKIENSKNSLVLGTFDGVHVGHQELINFAKYNKNNNKLAVFSFDNPIKYTNNQRLSTLEDKLNIFKALGIDYVYIIKVDENFKNISAEDFIDYILKPLNVVEIYCGSDFKFGKNKLGDINLLKSKFRKVYVLKYVKDYEGNKISSSIIKNKIIKGLIEEANIDLGRPFKIKGKIIKGLGKGKELGFPTINMELNDDYVLPKNGVYITKAKINDEYYNGITDIGTCPTIKHDEETHIETHLLNFNEDIYGNVITLYFLRRIRDEKKFSSKEALIEEVNLNIKEANEYFN